MSGRMSQRKGRTAEIELAGILRGYGYDVKPGQAVSFGATPDLIGLPGIHIESKRRERLELYAALKQASEDAQYFSDGLPAIFHRANRKPWLVTMTLDSWMELYERSNSNDVLCEVRTPGEADAQKR